MILAYVATVTRCILRKGVTFLFEKIGRENISYTTGVLWCMSFNGLNNREVEVSRNPPPIPVI